MTSQRSDILEHISLLFKWRKFIILNVLFFSLFAAGISLILPQWYSAESSVLIPGEDNTGFSLSAIFNKIPLSGLGMGLGGVSAEGTLFLAILNSRTIMEDIIDQFNLISIYNVKNQEEAIKEFRKHISIKINDEGTISIKTSAKTKYFPNKEEINNARQLAKSIADAFVEKLDNINKELKTERAKNNRIFIEKRYLQNLEDLTIAEENYKSFQNKYGAIDLTVQTASIIKTISEIKAQIILKEINMNVFKATYGTNSGGTQTIKNELDQLQKKYNQLLSMNDKDIKGIKDPFLPIQSIPDIGIEYARLYRELKMQEVIMEFLLPQYEQAKIQEAKDTPTVQVLDKAEIPIKKSKPKRLFFVLMISFIIGSISIGYVEWKEKMIILKQANIERYNILIALQNDIYNDLNKINFFKRKL